MSEGAGAGPIETLPVGDGRKLAIIVYILFFAGYFFGGLTNIVGVIMAHMKASDSSPVYQSHLRYQIRTFWVGLLFGIIGVLLLAVKIGILILLIVGIWTLVRNIKGFVRVLDGRPIDKPATWLI